MVHSYGGSQKLMSSQHNCQLYIYMLCRLGHDTRHFNVGQYRRKQRGEDEIQDASFFDHKNPVRCAHASHTANS